MNKQPVSYLQTDSRWNRLPYATKNEYSTIGGSGCGPTAAAMLLETLTGKEVLPTETIQWALQHGYKAYKQGTYYSYFVPQFKAYGIECVRLNMSRILNKPDHPIHAQAEELLKEGYYLIALMGPGLWTSSGHYVVVWDVDDSYYYINDSNSTRSQRTKGDKQRFRNECRMYWAIDAVEYNKGGFDMTQEEFNEKLDAYFENLKKKGPSNWSEDAREWAEKNELILGDEQGNLQYKMPVTREQMVIFMKRLFEMK